MGHMTGTTFLNDTLSWSALVGWGYLVTNSARLFTYIPQIAAVWRSRDGARALSLITWTSWVVSHAMAVLYGAVVLRDMFFMAVSTINLVCCAVVVAIAARRRGSWRGAGSPVALASALQFRASAGRLTRLPDAGNVSGTLPRASCGRHGHPAISACRSPGA
jgi:uncharacterized protein with PQ loop repeat